MKRYGMLLFFIMIVSQLAFAEPPSEDDKRMAWVNFGLGVDTDEGLSGNLSGNYAVRDNQLLTLRAAGSDFIFADFYDIALLYGYMWKQDEGYLSLSAGAGFVTVHISDVFDNGEHETDHTIGLPLEAQAFYTPFEHFGVGLIGYGDINSIHSFGGIVAAIQIGKLKT